MPSEGRNSEVRKSASKGKTSSGDEPVKKSSKHEDKKSKKEKKDKGSARSRSPSLDSISSVHSMHVDSSGSRGSTEDQKPPAAPDVSNAAFFRCCSSGVNSSGRKWQRLTRQIPSWSI